MAQIITKGLIGQQDLSIGTSTFTRATSTGGTQTLNQISGLLQFGGASDATAQAANISSSSLIAAGTGGFYQVTIGINTTQLATVSSTRPSVTLTYTDADSSQVISNTVIGPDSSNLLTNPYAATVSINVKAGTAVTYTTSGYLSSGATPMQYAIHIRATGPF
jgi:hypothetical protein